MRIRNRKLAALSIAGIAMLGLAACAPMADEPAAEEPSMEAPDDSGMDNAAFDDLVGPGCEDYATQVPDGDGSIVGMSTLQVTDAAAANPILTSLVKAVSGEMNPDVDLVSTLNGGEFTVFAPVDDAFAKLDAATLETLSTPEGAETLSKVLTYHVVPGQILPEDLSGEYETAEGSMVTVSGSGDMLKVDDANVICGGVHTANATVYLIDSVMMPAE
ncbi:fasciclin domain-containing protein [Homoserinibacter sp. YIM 151385]|uniref:fasciclin domain-containing protein n=1 Tax=Homoserinibacter sp. YIM 151385 TaxID=2985506 RepID=UPI0022F0A3D7|nr:fasciclin domain-containing protein [Homoserinibacter sp. YIM 151385]WBU36699.1 fasciclin domain-containing protein [Homoserinibacter sp. YIM 151385]